MSVIRVAIIAALVAVCTAQRDPNVVCFEYENRRNHKDMYADDTDCHYYYTCQYLEAGQAIGNRQQCPEGQFFHEPVLSCMPEGDTPCVDRCLSDTAISFGGCYAGAGCRQFFVCSNTGSFGMCCPLGSVFVESSCSCEESETCADDCVQPSPAVATSVAPASQYNATVCQDSFGTYISIVPGESVAYWLLDAEGNAVTKQYCPTGVAFDLTSCRCNTETGETIPDTQVQRRAILRLNFDVDTQDSSISGFTTFTFDGADRDTTQAAQGAGSLAVNGGYLSVPGLKSFDYRSAGSWCAFYTAGATGGIISNNKDSANSDYTAIFGAPTSSSFSGRISFWDPVNDQTVQSPAPASGGWNHFCVTYDGNSIVLYLNGQIADTQFVGGHLTIGYGPFAVGHDQALGSFSGNIDEVLVAPFALTSEEVNAHRNGNLNL